MIILQSLKFLFSSSEARAEYVKGQVEGMMVHQASHNCKTTITYKDDGFYLLTNIGNRFYRWVDIQEISAYKVDLITIDDLRIDIDFGDVVLTFSEDLPSWNEFIKILSTKLENVLQDWENLVLHTPFATNLTLIYKKSDTSKDGG